MCFIIFFSISSPFAKEKKKSFEVQSALSYIRDLSSDSMLGRKSGQRGGGLAEEYVALKFKEWGLEPGGENGTYFQKIQMEYWNLEEGVVMEIVSGRERRSFYHGEEWRVEKFSGSAHLMEEIVFVGYGINAYEGKYDDYQGVDLKGKIALLSVDIPEKLRSRLKEETIETGLEERILAARKRGASGVMLFRQEGEEAGYFRLRLKKDVFDPNFFIVSVEKKVTDFIFKDLSLELRYLLREIEEKGSPFSIETGVEAFLSFKTDFDEKREARNVLAKITGNDEKMRNEYLILGAHLDHLGRNPLGEVMNGANDNASGTAVVMEVARVLNTNRSQFKRTIIFALWAGEEQGLLGSKYYVEHPLFPLEKTIVYLNLDMVGQGKEALNFWGEYYGPQIWRILKERLPHKILERIKPGRGGPGGSDHTPFLMEGIQAFALMSDGYHLKYHQSRDDFDLIRPEVLRISGEFVTQALEILSSEPEDFFTPPRKETFYLKYQDLINHRFLSLETFIAEHFRERDSHVDIQLVTLQGKGEERGDMLRIEILKKFLNSYAQIEKSEGLSLYSSSGKIKSEIRMGKTTIIPGVKNIEVFRDEPEWASLFSKVGVIFVFLDDAENFFEEKGLNEKGKEVLSSLFSASLLLILKNFESQEIQRIYDEFSKPIVILDDNLPDQSLIEKIKKTKSALGLIMKEGEGPLEFFEKLDKAKSLLGSEFLFISNEKCLWNEEGKKRMLALISELLKAGYSREDFSNLFSETFLRVLREARGEAQPERMPFIPF